MVFFLVYKCKPSEMNIHKKVLTKLHKMNIYIRERKTTKMFTFFVIFIFKDSAFFIHTFKFSVFLNSVFFFILVIHSFYFCCILYYISISCTIFFLYLHCAKILTKKKSQQKQTSEQ